MDKSETDIQKIVIPGVRSRLCEIDTTLLGLELTEQEEKEIFSQAEIATAKLLGIPPASLRGGG